MLVDKSSTSSSSSSEEDWFLGGQAAVAAHGGPPAAAPPLGAAGAPPAPVPGVGQLVLGRVLKRPAAAVHRAAGPLGGDIGGSDPQLQGVQKLAQIMFGPRTQRSADNLLASHSGLAAACGWSKGRFLTQWTAMAQTAYTKMATQLVSMIGGITSAMGLRQVGSSRVLFQPLFFIRWRKYDETPMKRMQVPVQVSGGLLDFEMEMSDGSQKLLVTEAGWALGMRQTTDDSCRTLSMMGSQPTTLQVLERTSAECLRVALQQLNMPYDSLVNEKFFRIIDVAMTDEAGSNLKVERAMLAEGGSRKSLLHIICDAHKIAACHTQSFALLRPWDSRLIRMALSVDGLGMAALRRSMRSLLSERLTIVYSGHPSSAATAHRVAVFQLYLGGTSAKCRYRRSLIEGLFNGDIRRRSVVEHFENGCCKSRQETLSLMVGQGVRALLGMRLRVMSRSNWTGVDEAMAGPGLAEAIHGLFSQSYCRAFPGDDGDVGAPQAQDGGDVAAEEEFGPEPEQEAAGAGDQCDEALGGAGDDGSVPQVSIWREEARHRVSATRAWLQSGAFSDSMLLAQIQFLPQSARMLRQLSVTGEQWERREQRRLVETGLREYQIVEAHRATADVKLLQAAGQLVFDLSRWMPLARRDEQQQLLCYRVAARATSSAYELLYRRHTFWPYKLFGILINLAEVVPSLLACKSCMLDEFTLGFRRAHAQGGLTSEVALTELTTLAAVCKTDTATVERWHSRNQRRANFRVWSHAQDLPSMSADFVAMRSRDMLGSLVSSTAQELGAGRRQPADFGQGVGEGQVRRPGAGGAWRAYVHVNARGQQLTAALSASLSEGYQALAEAERQYYDELGELAAIAKQQGELGFGRRARNRAPAVAGAVGGAIDGLEVVLGCDGPALRTSSAASLPAGASGRCRILDDAKAAFKMAQEDLDADEQEIFAARKQVSGWARQNTEPTLQAWRPVASLAAVGAEGGLEQIPHSAAIVEQRPQARAFVAEVAEHSAASPPEFRSKTWLSAHQAICQKDCPKIGRLPSHRRLCHEAQLCTCSGRGLLLNRLFKRVRAAFHQARLHLGKLVFQPLLVAGLLVLKVTHENLGGGEVQPALADTAASPHGSCVPGADVGELWLHIALMYSSPWRPTFVLLRRDTSGDRGIQLGVEVVRARDDAPSPLVVRSVWETLDQMINLEARVTVDWFRLVSAERRVHTITPFRQRVTSLGAERIAVWKGNSEEGRRRRGPAKRPRVARPRGPEPLPIEGPPPPAPPLLDVDSEASFTADEEEAEDGPILENDPEGERAAQEVLDFLEDEDDLFGESDDPFGGPRHAAPEVASDAGQVVAADPEPEVGPADFDHALEMIGEPPPLAAEPAAPAAAGALVLAEPAPVLAAAAGRGKAENCVVLPGMRGLLRWYPATNTVVTHCARHEGGKCRLTRTLNPSARAGREGQGRPLGLCLAWSANCPFGYSAEEHVHAFHPTLAQRQAARLELEGFAADMPLLRDLLDRERPLRPGEPAEPETIP